MNFPKGLKRSAAMVVLRNDRHFLLLQRQRPPHVGKFVPVGGKLEPFEDPYAAAIRETREETGFELQRLTYGGVLIETSPTDYNWQCNIYLADIPRVEPPPCPEGVLQWIAFEEVPQLPTPPTDWHIYQFLMQGRPFALNAKYDEHLNLQWMVEELSGERLLP